MIKHPDPLFELHTGSTVRPADDLVSLKQHLPGGKFRYVDIASQQSRTQALSRWPLLAELANIPVQMAPKSVQESDKP